MSVQSVIENKLSDTFSPDFMQVENESHMHSVPVNSETHFKVIVVTDQFDGKSRVQRHQLINKLLSDELKGPVHALSMQTHTVAEWQERNQSVLTSPLCHGGSKQQD